MPGLALTSSQLRNVEVCNILGIDAKVELDMMGFQNESTHYFSLSTEKDRSGPESKVVTVRGLELLLTERVRRS